MHNILGTYLHFLVIVNTTAVKVRAVLSLTD